MENILIYTINPPFCFHFEIKLCKYSHLTIDFIKKTVSIIQHFTQNEEKIYNPSSSTTHFIYKICNLLNRQHILFTKHVIYSVDNTFYLQNM